MKRFSLLIVMCCSLTGCGIFPEEASGEVHDVCIVGYKYRVNIYPNMKVISSARPIVDSYGNMITCVTNWTD